MWYTSKTAKIIIVLTPLMIAIYHLYVSNIKMFPWICFNFFIDSFNVTRQSVNLLLCAWLCCKPGQNNKTFCWDTTPELFCKTHTLNLLWFYKKNQSELPVHTYNPLYDLVVLYVSTMATLNLHQTFNNNNNNLSLFV